MSTGRRGRVTLAVLLAVCGGLATAGGAAAPWLRLEAERDVGGVPLTEVETVGGMALAPRLLPIGLVATLAGAALLLARGRLQQGTGVALLVLGLVAGALVVLSVADAPPDATPAAGIVLAGLGAVSVAAAGLLALRPARPARLPARYDLDADDDADEEWRMASQEDGEERPS